jgi:hypothetical protein
MFEYTNETLYLPESEHPMTATGQIMFFFGREQQLKIGEVCGCQMAAVSRIPGRTMLCLRHTENSPGVA